MSEPMKRRGMSGKDVITVGIFSAIYFVINFAFMLLGGLHPLLWILMPGFIALFTGIPYLMMCAKVQKVGSVLLMGLITGLIYYVTGQFTVVILVSFVLACGLAELSPGASPITGAWLETWYPLCCSRWAWWDLRCPSGSCGRTSCGRLRSRGCRRTM